MRNLDPDALSLELTLDGRAVRTRTSASGAQTASFTLPDDEGGNVSELIATWSYDVDGISVTIARSFPVEITPDSPRAVVIDRYDYGFDTDADGSDNLDELVAGSDPLDGGDSSVAFPMPDGEAVDCRSYPNEGFPPPIELPAILALRDMIFESFAVTPNSANGNVYYGAYRPEVDGKLRIEHTGGSPVDTDAILHLRRPTGEQPTNDPAADNLGLYDTRDFPLDGQRVIVPPPPNTSFTVDPEFVYCFVLFTRAGEGFGAPGLTALSDTVIQVEFIPDPDE